MSEHNGYYRDVEMSKEVRDWIKSLESEIDQLEKANRVLREACESIRSSDSHDGDVANLALKQANKMMESE